MNSEDGQVYSVCILQFSCSTKYTLMQSNINKQNVNIADETLKDNSFFSRYHYTKSKNYLKRWYRICHCISMFIGTPCTTCIVRQNIAVTYRLWIPMVVYNPISAEDRFRPIKAEIKSYWENSFGVRHRYIKTYM